MTALALKREVKADLFREDFAAHGGALPGAGLPWLDAKRAKAMAAFAHKGMPTRRTEAWKYTDLASALEPGFEPAKPAHAIAAADSVFAGAEAFRFSFVNGFLEAGHDTPFNGIEIADLSALDGNAPEWVRDNLGNLASSEDQPLGAVSLALMRGGVALRVKGNVAQPVHLDFRAQSDGMATVSHARVLIVIEENSSLQLLESHVSDGAHQGLANLGIELVLKDGAALEHVRLQENPGASHLTTLGARLSCDARYRALYAALGGKLSRVDANIRLAAAGAEASIRNVCVIGDGIADITMVMDHASPHTVSRQLFKNVVGGHGKAVNQGRVTVREGAVKSDSHQLFKSLLLSPRAEADAKPELEIYADDVVCGHGAAVGALDADALFYLRARGIPEREARGLLTRAFLEETLEGFVQAPIHDALWRRLDAALLSLAHGDA